MRPSHRASIVLRVRPVNRPLRGRADLASASLAAVSLAAVCLATACSASPAGPPSTASSAAPATATAVGPHQPGAAASPVPKPSSRPKPASKPRVVMSTVRTADGAVITVAIFRGPVTYVLHNGSEDPGLAASSLGVKAGPAIGPAERKRLLAAFNGGFKLAGGAGGYEQQGKVASPLVEGDASLIIDRSGKAHIGVWGHGAPAPGERVYSVRQNLQPLVEDGRPAASAIDWWDWGGTVEGLRDVARSALGEDSAGNLIYAASMSALPEDLAVALVEKGARIGMELDINPNWVQLDVASYPGGPLRAAVPGQWHPADQYIDGWTRDFITVLG